MKKIIGLLIIISVAFGAYFFIQSEYSGVTYYTKITNKGKKITEKTRDGANVTSYEYKLKSANEKGEEKTLTFRAPNRTKPLKMNAYLKLEYNNNKGVLNWEEVQTNKVPAKALAKLK